MYIKYISNPLFKCNLFVEMVVTSSVASVCFSNSTVPGGTELIVVVIALILMTVQPPNLSSLL